MNIIEETLDMNLAIQVRDQYRNRGFKAKILQPDPFSMIKYVVLEG